MRRYFLLVLIIAGCSSKIGKNQEGTVDARPIDFREPPEPKNGSGTAPGCGGVTVRGECQQSIAVNCELDRGEVRKVDCGALGQDCIVDVSRGVGCKKIDEDPNGGASSPCADTGISETGFCTAAGEAIFCDTSDGAPVTKIWACTAEGMTCGVNDCAQGASCCGDSEPAPVDCEGLDFRGECDGMTARWCNPSTSGLEVLDCQASGMRCEIDTCSEGAYCCGDSDPTDECATLGFDGICTSDNSLRYCPDDTVTDVTCFGETTCQVDACGSGAYCCEPETVPTNRCTEMGADGVCSVTGDLEFCLGDSEEDITVIPCDPGDTCQVDTCYSGGAECCPDIDPCANLDILGTCDGDTLRYCINDILTEVDCSAEPNESCQEDTCFPGGASCCSIL